MRLEAVNTISGYHFHIERYRSRLHFVIFHNTEEIACSKEEIQVLKSFIHSKEQGIWHGRIKLRSTEEYVVVYLKGECLGQIVKKSWIEKIDILNRDI